MQCAFFSDNSKDCQQTTTSWNTPWITPYYQCPRTDLWLWTEVTYMSLQLARLTTCPLKMLYPLAQKEKFWQAVHTLSMNRCVWTGLGGHLYFNWNLFRLFSLQLLFFYSLSVSTAQTKQVVPGKCTCRFVHIFSLSLFLSLSQSLVGLVAKMPALGTEDQDGIFLGRVIPVT